MDRNSNEFKKLQAKWYGKLKEDGFEDIEQSDGHLKIWVSHFFNRSYDEITMQAREDYYRIGGQFLYEHKFKNAREKFIWKLHVEGKMIKEIVVALEKKRTPLKKSEVHRTIQRLVEKMKCSIRI